MASRSRGKLVLIGGGALEAAAHPILTLLAEEANKVNRPLLLVTAATYAPDGVADEYGHLLGALGLKRMEVLDIRTRRDAYDERNIQKCSEASVILFSGGDQLRITSQLGGTPVLQAMLEHHLSGCTIAGTSAGAAAMPASMITGNPSDTSGRLSSLMMGPGLGLLNGVVIDSHFAERGRLGRLLGAVVRNPGNLGIGIDTSTAIVVERNDRFHVLGGNAVYVVDGSAISYSTLSEEPVKGSVALHDAKIHVLVEGMGFDLARRRPLLLKELREQEGIQQESFEVDGGSPKEQAHSQANRGSKHQR
jgi:cyanophycinase